MKQAVEVNGWVVLLEYSDFFFSFRNYCPHQCKNKKFETFITKNFIGAALYHYRKKF